MANTQAAKRYARTLFELAREEQVLDPVQSDMVLLGKLLVHVEEWRALTDPYLVTPEARKKLFRTVFSGRLHALTLRFLLFLVDKDRNPLLREIVEQFTGLYNEVKGIVAVRIISAQPLEPQQLAALVDRLKTRLGKQIAPVVEVDASLLGGFQIRVADQVYDCSLNYQLNQAYRKLVAA